MDGQIFFRMFFIMSEPFNVTCNDVIATNVPWFFDNVEDRQDGRGSWLFRSHPFITFRTTRFICASRGNASKDIMQRVFSIMYRFLSRFVR